MLTNQQIHSMEGERWSMYALNKSVVLKEYLIDWFDYYTPSVLQFFAALELKTCLKSSLSNFL